MIIDTAATGPVMKGKAYDKEKNHVSFISARFLDEGSQNALILMVSRLLPTSISKGICITELL